MDPRIQTSDRDLIIIANAGAGKTRLLVEHYFELLAQGFEPHQMVAFTFTEKAASELRERIQNGLREHPSFAELPQELLEELKLKIRRAPIGTIHQFCLRLIESAAQQNKQYRIIDEAIEIEIRENLLSSELKKRFKSLDPAALLLLDAYGIRRLRELLIDTLKQLDLVYDSQKAVPDLEAACQNEIELLNALETIASSLQQSIAEEKRRHDYLSFDDMEKQALELIETSPELIQKQLLSLHHLLIDEFQDTSPVQIQIIKALQKFQKGRKRELRLFLVGDPKQSIYRFRQVDGNLIQKTQEEIIKAGGLRFDSVENYRSAPAILALVNDFSSSSFPKATKSLAMLAEAENTKASLVPIKLNEEKRNAAELRKTEAEQVVQAIAECIKNGIQLEDIAVLYRASNSALALTEVLQRYGIPFSVKGGQNLFDRQEILDLKRLLYFLHKPADDISLIGLLRSPLFLISDATLFFLTRIRPKGALYDYLQNCPLEEVLEIQNHELEKLRWSLETLSSLLRESRGLSAYAILQKVVLRFNFSTLLSLAYQNSDSLLHIEQWLDWLRLLEEENQIVTLAQTVKTLKTLENSELHKTPLANSMAGQGGIQLMTMHAAKGLQFDTVFLIDLARKANNKYPFLISWGEQRALKWIDENYDEAGSRYQKIKELHQQEEAEEEKRLLYVALTRAQRQLFVMYDPQNNNRGSLQNILLESLGDNLAKYHASFHETTQGFSSHEKNKTKLITHQESSIQPRPATLEIDEWLNFACCPLQHHFHYHAQLGGPEELGERKKRIAQLALKFLKNYSKQELKPWLKNQMIEARLDQEAWVVDAFEGSILSYFDSTPYQKLQNSHEFEAEVPFLLQTAQGRLRGTWDGLFRDENKPWQLAHLSDDSDFLSSRLNLLRLKTSALAALRFFRQEQIQVELHALGRDSVQTMEFSLAALRPHEMEIDTVFAAMPKAALDQVKISEACESCRFNRQIPLCPLPQGLPWKPS